MYSCCASRRGNDVRYTECYSLQWRNKSYLCNQRNVTLTFRAFIQLTLKLFVVLKFSNKDQSKEQISQREHGAGLTDSISKNPIVYYSQKRRHQAITFDFFQIGRIHFPLPNCKLIGHAITCTLPSFPSCARRLGLDS